MAHDCLSMAKKSFPVFVPPMMANSVKEPFDSPDWIFEMKLDGYRAISVIERSGSARVWSPNGLTLEKKFPAISKGRELTEYFTCETSVFGIPGAMFILTRRESPQPDGGTQVDESRKYFGENEHGNVQLIRELRKSARFKPGESTDTVHTPNIVVDLRRQPKDNRTAEERSEAISKFVSKPEEIAVTLQKAGPPEFDPFVNVKGDSEKFRVIHGTASPDGRYVIALGFAGKDVDWDDFVDRMEQGLTEGEEGLRNYGVDLASQKILGETGCNYFGTSRRYNNRECTVTWSPDSLKFVELWDDKWRSTACVAGKIIEQASGCREQRKAQAKSASMAGLSRC
jgi:hypothetical protein